MLATFSQLIMRNLFVLFILQLTAVRGDTHLKREVGEPYAVVERSNFSPRREDGSLARMMDPRADPGAVASNICGYLGGQIDQPWLCVVTDLYCVVEPNEGVVGCCYSNFCGAFRTACIAQTDPCDSACSSNDQNLLCTGSNPICATYTYPNSVTELRCDSTVPSILSIAYTYSGFSTPIGLPRIAAGFSITSQGASFSYLSLLTGTQNPSSSTAAPSSTPSSTFATSTSAPAPGTTSTSTPAPGTTANPVPSASSNAPTSAPSTSPAAAASTSSSTPVGAIVGGVVGGLAVIAAFAALVVWLQYKKGQRPVADPYPQMFNTNNHNHNPASASQLSPAAATPANERKDEQTRSVLIESYAPPESGHYVATPSFPTELHGQTRWS